MPDKSGLLAAYIACKHSGMKDLWTGQSIVMHGEIDRQRSEQRDCLFW